jgi:hypothetical protein
MTIVTAVGTALGAIQLFQPKLAIGIAMKRETGGIEPAFRGFYTLPQYVIGAIVLLVWVVLFGAVLHQLTPRLVPAYPGVRTALNLLDLKNLIPVLLVLSIIAGVIQMNILSWILLLLGRGVSILPFGATSRAFGWHGRSAGWLQAWLVCRTWDKGQPLLISQDELERVGDALLLKLSAPTYRGQNFAPKPDKASNAAAANIALLGCIIEEAHSTNHWTKPTSWEDFYNALADINVVNKMFEPAELLKFKSGREFSQVLRDELAKRMHAKGQTVPEANYYGAASYVAKSWELLKADKGMFLEALPSYARVVGIRLHWLDQHLAKFPLLHREGMRQQVIKLMTRWCVTPWGKQEDFLQPFSKTQAWLLLQEGVLTTLPEQDDVTFRAAEDVGISKVACRRIFEHVKLAAQEKQSAEAISVSRRFSDAWDLAAAADYTLWNWAHEQLARGEAEDWKGWRWKLESGRASKVS